MSHSVFLGLSASNIHPQSLRAVQYQSSPSLLADVLWGSFVTHSKRTPKDVCEEAGPHQVHQHLVLASRSIVYLSLFHVVVVVVVF